MKREPSTSFRDIKKGSADYAHSSTLVGLLILLI